MADLRPSADRRDDRRGQIILVGAFALAVAFVALALVMNAAIYTENLATRSESAETANAHAFHRATAMMASESFSYAHDSHSTHDALDRSVRDAVEIYHNATRRQQAANGQLTNVSVASTDRGVNITNTDGPFKNATGPDDWTVASNVGRFHEFRLDVEGWPGSDSEELRVVADTPETWYLNVSYDGSDYTVGVNDSGTYSTCEPSINSGFTIDFSAGTVAGNDCAALDLESRSDPYDLKFENGSVASGDYTMVVNGTAETYVGGGQKTEVLYSMDVDLVYWSSDVRYRSTIRLGPGDIDG